ncbi:hypothetical protein [Rhodanobacter sp. K2T2]|uniref:hypothetical protein n=1 Tax=Rhodanobacter sp. K2T2 TaxID=2723085 RepID=UPI001C54094A|nr:hypothetical protein [Rhodanobacter sp. K2T2]
MILERRRSTRRNRRKAFVSMFLASSICLVCDSAGYAQVQNAPRLVPSSASTPNSNSSVNFQPLTDDFLNTLINLPKNHQGKIAYDDIKAVILRETNCVNDKYSESNGVTSGTKNIKFIWVKSHCLDGMKVEYVGETRPREGSNFKYKLALNWYPSSKAECISAGHVMALVKEDGWNFPPVNPRPGRESQETDEGLSNYQSFQSSAAGGAALVFLWTLPVGSHSITAVPIEQSCLASLVFSEHQ